MKKFVQEKPHIAGLITFFVVVFVAAFFFLPSFFETQTVQENRVLVNKDGETWTLPQGVYTFSVASAGESIVKFAKGEIDPPDVHVGDTQKFMIEVSAETGIKSVKAIITTDTKTQEVALSNEGANVWRGSWVVEDTHDARYTTRFVAEDNAGNSDFFDIAWSDACGIGLTGDWGMVANNGGNPCTISGVDGVDNGNVAINASTMTVNGTFVWNSGKAITISGGGKIVLGAGGKIQQGDLYMSDADSDGYPANSTQSTTGGAGMRRKSVLTSFSVDCNNSNAAEWQNLTGYPDADSDGVNSPSGSTVCAGASLPVARQTAGSDCNDGNASVWQDWGGYIDADGDGVLGSSYEYICGGSTNPGVSGTPGSDCNDYDYSVSAYKTCYTDNDTDGYTVGSGSSFCQSGDPYHYECQSLGTDCDDSSAGVWQIVQKYLDSDHDGYGTGILQPFCIGYAGGATDCLITGWCSNNNSDCNDSNAGITTGSTYYRDADNDGYGVSTPTTTACSQPAGYASNTSDCNDGSASYNVGNCITGTLTGGSVAQGSSVLGEFTVTQNTSNGYGPIITSSISGLPSGTTCGNYPNCGPSSYYNVPTGGTTNHPVQFNVPSNAAVGTYSISMSASLGSESATMSGTIVVTQGCTTGYKDYDKDGYGTGASGCYVPDAAYNVVANNTDCNDSNASIGPASNLYYDDDGDGYGAGPANLRCPTADWVTTNTDCLDNYTVQYSEYVYPGANWYAQTPVSGAPLSGYDVNCDGQITKEWSTVWYMCNEAIAGPGSYGSTPCQSGYSWSGCPNGNQSLGDRGAYACGSTIPGITGADTAGNRSYINSGCTGTYYVYGFNAIQGCK